LLRILAPPVPAGLAVARVVTVSPMVLPITSTGDNPSRRDRGILLDNRGAGHEDGREGFRPRWLSAADAGPPGPILIHEDLS
jgi:hypothetical protein